MTTSQAPRPNVGTWVSGISTVRAGASGAPLSEPGIFFDSASFTVAYDSTGPNGIRQIKIALDPAGTFPIGDITAKSLILGAGLAGQTNLDVTGTTIFRNRVRFADGGDGVWPTHSIATPKLGAGENSKTAVVTAGLVPLRIGDVGWVPESSVGPDGTDFVEVSLYLSDLAVGDGGEALIGSATISSADGAWTAGVQTGLFTIPKTGGIYTLAAQKRIVARVTANGAATLAYGGSVVVYAPT